MQVLGKVVLYHKKGKYHCCQQQALNPGIKNFANYQIPKFVQQTHNSERYNIYTS